MSSEGLIGLSRHDVHWWMIGRCRSDQLIHLKGRGVRATIDGVPVHYSEHGIGTAVLALHGSYSAHQEVEGFLEPLFRVRPDFRRIYLDLPGMGDTPAPARIRSSNDVLELVLGFVDAVIGDEAFLVVGHSAGG